MMHKFVVGVLTLSFVFLFSSCMNNDSADSEKEKGRVRLDDPSYAVKGGHLVPFRLGTTESPFGYYLFLPESYQHEAKTYPLLVFFHGSGERGNSKNDPSALELALAHGPGKLIKEGEWHPDHEMLVVSAQTHSRWGWNSKSMKRFIDYLTETYKVDRERIYLTGVSMGAYGIFDYLGAYGEKSNIAAAIPICGRGRLREKYLQNLTHTPIWVFHGEDDESVPVEGAHEIVSAINARNPLVRAKMTLYPNVGHDSWTMTYDGSGMGKENPNFDPFDQDVYSWLLQYKRP